jgi:hypothetical protein
MTLPVKRDLGPDLQSNGRSNSAPNIQLRQVQPQIELVKEGSGSFFFAGQGLPSANDGPCGIRQQT